MILFRNTVADNLPGLCLGTWFALLKSTLTAASSFLSPLGNFRKQHTQTSKGKRIKNRKRHVTGSTEPGSITPSAPAIRQYVDIGLTTVTRGLQETSTIGHDTTKAFRPYSVIFVARSGQPGGINSHLPQMVAASSGLCPSQPPIRIVGLSRSCEQRLTSALGIPRVSCIGVMGDAPNSKALIEFIHKRVPVIDVAWLREAVSGGYRDTKIKTIETIDRKKPKPSICKGREQG